MQKVIICAGPGSSKHEAARSIGRQTGVDVLTCTDSADIQRNLVRYSGKPATFMLQYYMGNHPSGSRGAVAWHPGFMDALDDELDRSALTSSPNIKTEVNQDTGSVFLVCPWSGEVDPDDVVRFARAVEASLTRSTWNPL